MVVSRFWWLLHLFSARRNEVRGASPPTPRTVGAVGTANQACTHRGGVALAGHCRTGTVLVADAAHPQIGVSLACTWASLGFMSPSLSWGRASVRPCGSPPHGRHSLLRTAGTRPATTHRRSCRATSPWSRRGDSWWAVCVETTDMALGCMRWPNGLLASPAAGASSEYQWRPLGSLRIQELITNVCAFGGLGMVLAGRVVQGFEPNAQGCSL
jgi:hypothetical protein